MDRILIIDKPKDYTSRDAVNLISKKYNTKHVGHAGTLDPMATGVLVICVGKYLKLIELLTNHDKEYIATIKLGIETDTLDITGNILKEKNKLVTREEIIEVLNNFKGKIKQQVPIYSAIKVNGRKLYEYARNNIEVELPIKDVEIYDISLLGDIKYDNNDITFSIKCHVSKGTYIRSLIRDIGYKLDTYATMTDLRRIKQGKIDLTNSNTLEDINNGELKELNVLDVLDMEKVIIKDNDLLKKIKNGVRLEKFFDSSEALLVDINDNIIAIYKEYDNNMVKPWKMF